MKNLFIATLCIISMQSCSGQVNWSKVKSAAKTITKTDSSGTKLTNEEIIRGLKEALNVGVNNSTAAASKTDGFLKNAKIFIPFPPEAKQIEQKLRELGFGAKVDQFNTSLNRAAEEAAKQAAPIFLDAVKGMTISDGLGILKGGDNAATEYLKKGTTPQLTAKFTPIINTALSKTLATKYWTELVTLYNKIPTVQKLNPDLSQYATSKAIDGLFILVADEEAKIRKNPAARVSDILKKVFGTKV